MCNFRQFCAISKVCPRVAPADHGECGGVEVAGQPLPPGEGLGQQAEGQHHRVELADPEGGDGEGRGHAGPGEQGGVDAGRQGAGDRTGSRAVH